MPEYTRKVVDGVVQIHDENGLVMIGRDLRESQGILFVLVHDVSGSVTGPFTRAEIEYRSRGYLSTHAWAQERHNSHLRVLCTPEPV